MSVAQNDISETENYYKDTQSELIGNDNNKETQNNYKKMQNYNKWIQNDYRERCSITKRNCKLHRDAK